MESGNLKLPKLIKATLKENLEYIRKVAGDFDVQPALLLYITSVLIQPCLEEIARKIDESLLDKWWQASCPVCGRIPVVAKLRHRKRYLVCTFCGAEYLSDHFICVHCENKDPYTLKYLIIKMLLFVLKLLDLPAGQTDFVSGQNGGQYFLLIP